MDEERKQAEAVDTASRMEAEQERIEQERIEKERIEKERIEQEQAEKEKAAQEEKKEKKAKRRKKKGALWYGVWSQICMMIMMGTIVSLALHCLVSNASGMLFWINPIWREADSFEQSYTYGEMLHYDLGRLTHFIGAASQLETNGSFDENKNVDILQYVYRESGKVPERFGDLKLVYRIGDLIEWEQEGFSYESVIEEDVIEEDVIEAVKPGGQQTETEQYEIAEEEYDAIASVQAQQSKIRFKESFLPVGGISLYDLELPEGVTCDELAGYVEKAAHDLSYNYQFYQNNVGRYKGNRNIKNRNLRYMMLDSGGKVRFTNLDTKGMEVSKLKRAFEESDSYVIYDYGDNTIERHNNGDYDTDISAKSLFHAYNYLFPDGGTLYIAIQTGDSSVFGDYAYDDCYARARESYREIAGYGSMNLIAALVFGILAIVFWILFTARQPHRQPQELKGFDRWYTGIAAAFAFAVGTGLCALIFGLCELWYREVWGSNVRIVTGGYLQKDDFMLLLLCIGSILYLLFLLFWGSLVRRIKARTLWRGSLTCQILLWCRGSIQKIKAFLLRFACGFLNSKDFALRVALPYIGVLFLSVIVILATDGAPGGFFTALLLHGIILVCLYKCDQAREGILNGIDRICDGDLEYQIDTRKLVGRDKTLAENVNRIGQAIEEAVKANMKNERLKADLITNVSHDIKTPLTSIINYVDLLKRENIQGEKAQEYIRVLDEKSQRLKQLTLDLVEASKISSGNIVIEKTRLDVGELLQQAAGEYEKQLADRQLSLVLSRGEEKGGICISADPRHMWRVMDNLLGNVCKYALRGTRVYIDMIYTDAQRVQIVMKNISAQPLNIPVEELTLRFVRGDEARSTEGSGLGLSIAQNLTTAQGGDFEICLDGDLFKIIMTFPVLTDDIS